ncbi:MAG: ABC transporter permease [Candidatus Bipolaricaulota bacterium]|nr:ABC transporter permease [Candidatus Bipolaricaulota bacterium]
MLAYIARRLLLLPVIVLGVTVLIFLMLQLLSPYARLALYIQDPAQLKDPTQLERLIELHGLNDPVLLPFTHRPIEIPLGFTTLKIPGDPDCGSICYCHCRPQYFRWLGEVFRGNLGWSETDKMPVLNALVSRFPATLELAIFAILPLVLIGVLLGVLAAVYHNRPLDHVTRILSIMGYAFPTFVFGLLMLMLFYGKLGWFAPERLSQWASDIVQNPKLFTRFTGLNTLDALLNGRWDIFLDALSHIVLPVLTLSYVSWALIVRITRSSMLETLRQEYVTVARAKGQRELIVILKHACRNALIPVATISGLSFVGLLNGVVITETIFNYRGLGKFAADAAYNLDIPSVLGFTLFSTTVLVVMNLLVDLLYAWIDPRVRLE